MDDQRPSPSQEGDRTVRGSAASTGETGDVRAAWGRVTAWLERNDPETLTALGGPGSHAAIREAELRMGLDLPEELWQWLLANGIDAGRQPDDHSFWSRWDARWTSPAAVSFSG
ncbi:hypothetical protein ABZ619_09050 [Streptomyces sp. NPDC007851]|uniref:hypothetical protein n=1 Tax=Streptomyces sp. NPDC007851 TaxID=3155008 RepID=UPI0033EB5B29